MRADLIAALGTDDFEAAYAAGRNLSSDAAIKRVDPAPLVDLLLTAQRPVNSEP